MNYSIKDVSEKFNISPYTLRYYEKEELLPNIHRTSNGTRVYSDVDLEWLQLICCMRATGMSISYIKDYVDLCRQGDDTISKRREIIVKQKEIIENHIKEYNKLLNLVNKKLDHYDALTKFNGKMLDK